MDNEHINDTKSIENEYMNEQESVSQDTFFEENQAKNELVFQYPVEEIRGTYEDYFKQEYRKNKKTLYVLVVMFFGSLVCLTLYSMATASRLSSVFLIIGIAALVLTFMTAKGITNKRSLHFLSINADEKRLILTYYTQAKYYKREYIIPYNRILSCRFVNKDFTKIQFVLKSIQCSFYTINDEIDKTESTSFMVFNLNPLSYEQGYFMYVADNFFDIKGYQLTDKIIKKYGNADEYFEYLQEGSEVE